jgi:GNAT superfamily N-acetyltransferase
MRNGHFRVDLADEADKRFIVDRLRRLGRQTMNVRTMPDYEMLVLRDLEREAIVGWQGLDYRHRPGMAEIFSLQVDPAYRGLGLGLVLEHVAACRLLESAVPFAMVRMDRAGNGDLVRWRLETGCWIEATPDTLDGEFLRACLGCELHGQSCTQQIYLRFLPEAFRDYAERRIGALGGPIFPKEITVDDGAPQYRN